GGLLAVDGPKRHGDVLRGGSGVDANADRRRGRGRRRSSGDRRRRRGATGARGGGGRATLVAGRHHHHVQRDYVVARVVAELGNRARDLLHHHLQLLRALAAGRSTGNRGELPAIERSQLVSGLHVTVLSW